MKTFVLCSVFIIATSLSVSAQRRKTIFVEGLGNGILISGNFDIRLKSDRNDGFGLRAGIGGGSMSGTDFNGNYANVGLLTFPLSVNYIVGNRRSGFESGLGITPLYVSATTSTSGEFFQGSGFGATGFLNIGYRFQPIKKGVMFRVNWAPAFGAQGFQSDWFGVSLGFSFK